MNKLKISLENFQSISSGELEFQTGLNFIIGQSNSGKSATFRALKACLSNPSGSQRYIKKGTKKSTVTLEYNGNDITWVRTPKESSYSINGEEYVKTGNSSAFKILEDDLGFTQDFNDTIMNIEEELQLPFPFGMSKADLFKLYEDVFCVSDSSIILKSAKERESAESLEIYNVEYKIKKTSEKLEELDKFKKEVSLEKIKEFLNNLKRADSRLKVLADGMDVINLAVNLSAHNFSIPVETFKDLRTELSEKYACAREIKKAKALHSLGKDLAALEYPVLVNIDKYKALKDFEKVLEVSKISFRIEEFENKLGIYENLREYLKSLETIKSLIKDKSIKLKENEAKKSKLEAKLKEFKVCPLCHSVLEGDHKC